MGDAACNDNPERVSERLEREASLWLIRLEDEPDNLSLQKAFDTWLEEDARHAAAWQETLDVAQIVARAGIGARMPAMPGRRHVWSPALSRNSRRVWSGAAAGVAALCAAWIALPNLIVDARADQSTRTAEVRTTRLADGSLVTLAPSSAISLSFHGTKRDVRLLRGEAYFDVVHDASRPFRVLAGESRTRVLGTAFDVRLRHGRAVVAVSRGAVEVTSAESADPARVVLPMGQSLDIDEEGQATRSQVRPDRVAVWRQGQAIVDDKPLGDVIAALRPWFSGYILARGPGLATRRVTGLYNLRDPDAALAALAKAHPIDVRRLSPWLRIVTVR